MSKPREAVVPKSPNHLPTTFMLLAQYGGRSLIPIDEVCRDFFAHLTPEKLLQRAGKGEIKLPIVRMDASRKTSRGVYISDLADYLDGCREAARRELSSILRS